MHEIDIGISIKNNCLRIYHTFGKHEIEEHVDRVAKRAAVIGRQYGIMNDEIEIASYLHDISGITKKEYYSRMAKEEGIEVLSEEEKYPLLMHQKISKDIADKCFGIKSKEILSAIECHTTLKGSASVFDMVLFISDKLDWDQSGDPPWRRIIENGLDVSIEEATYRYIEYQIMKKEKLLVVHPWLENAYRYFRSKEIAEQSLQPDNPACHDSC